MKKLVNYLSVFLLAFFPLASHAALTDDLISYWKLDESSGNAYDSSGGGFTLTNNGSVPFSAGKISNAADFGATNTSKFLELTGGSALGLTFDTPVTYNFWVNVTTQQPEEGSSNPFDWVDNTTTNKKGEMTMQYYYNSGNPMFYIQRSDFAGNDQYGPAVHLSTGVWYMITYTWDGSNINFYLNGSSTASISGASTRTGTNTTTGVAQGFRIGNSNNDRWWKGLVDEFGVWSRVLSSSEIAQLYNNGNGCQYDFATCPPVIFGLGTTNRLAKFSSNTNITDSLFSDDGSNITLTSGNLFLPSGSLLDSTGSLNFGTSNATTMTFGRSGQNMIINSKVGIGTASPVARFHVIGDIFSNFISVLANGFGIDTYTAGTLSLGTATSTAITIGHGSATTTVSGPLRITSVGTTNNCVSSTSPAVCGSAPAGSVAMSSGTDTLQVNTTAVTPDSQIFVIEDSSLSGRLGITCSTGTNRSYTISSRSTSTSFTIKSSNNVTGGNKACLSYFIVN